VKVFKQKFYCERDFCFVKEDFRLRVGQISPLLKPKQYNGHHTDEKLEAAVESE
jgi:hypothetical protein